MDVDSESMTTSVAGRLTDYLRCVAAQPALIITSPEDAICADGCDVEFRSDPCIDVRIAPRVLVF